MKLHSARLLLREVTITDLDAIHSLHSLPEVDQFNTMGLPKDQAETLSYLSGWIQAQQESPRVKYVLAIETVNGEWLGLAGINIGKAKYHTAEFWYKFDPIFWNKGYATETVQLLLTFCFNELHLHRITAGCAIENAASIKVLEKCGFIREGHARKILPIRGEWVDNYEYAILEEDFKNC